MTPRQLALGLQIPWHNLANFCGTKCCHFTFAHSLFSPPGYHDMKVEVAEGNLHVGSPVQNRTTHWLPLAHVSDTNRWASILAQCFPAQQSLLRNPLPPNGCGEMGGGRGRTFWYICSAAS